jgi:inhibitor of cysteine peptidase
MRRLRTEIVTRIPYLRGADRRVRHWGYNPRMGLLYCLLVILLGCHSHSQPERLMHIGASADKTSITMAVGGELELALAANPTTGYSWAIAACDPAVLKLDSENYAQQGTATGSGGEATWHFSAVAPGTTTLRLEYRRPWEKVAPVQTFEVAVTVMP